MDDPTWNSVRSMLSTSLLKGMFWCRWTSRNWPKVIPDCDNSAEKWKVQMDDMEVLGLSLFPFLKKLAGTSRWSAVISQALDRCLRWHLTYPCSRCPLLSKKFYIFSDGSHTHTLPQEGGKLRSRQWDENEEEGKWKWGEDDNEMKVT